MNSFIAQQIRDIASAEILHELEIDGDAGAAARRLRAEIIAGWNAAMERAGAPAELMLALK